MSLKNIFYFNMLLVKLCFSQELKNNISILKNSKDFFCTSGILNKKHCGNYEKVFDNEKGYYGRYYFVSKKNELKNVINSIELTIQDTIKPWKFNNKTEIFVELTAYEFSLEIIPSVKQQTNLLELKKTFGMIKYQKNNYYVFQKEKLWLSFYMINNKILKYRIGIYNPVFNESLKKHLTSF